MQRHVFCKLRMVLRPVPPPMAAGETSNFTIQKSTDSQPGPRLGRLCLPGRKAIDTPHYIAISSRGAVPHLSQDTFAKQTHINGIYVALEDCKKPQKLPAFFMR